ncbi:unnamed protein product [Anisakis simplex]|uniref:Tumor protein d52, putative (inferred by orthology to a S. mansoni protein) n=1 Tax=Anisakis simplex TaxID=6269 RepID=A0A0M3K0Y5_ANISI|nr:unnamed protein product [Anisakis simplex]
MPPKKAQSSTKDQNASTPPSSASNASASTKKSADIVKTVKANDKMQAAIDKFAADLANDSDEESSSANATASSQRKSNISEESFSANGSATELSEAEKEIIREELKKTEDEINTLRQVLAARQKHAADLKRKLGISPLTELTADINQSLQHVKETQAYAKLVASTSIDQLSGHAKPPSGASSQADPTSPSNEKAPLA